MPVSRFVASHNANRIALACVALVAANVTISHLDLLQGKLTSFGLDDSSRARVYAMTYPVSKLFPPQYGSAFGTASNFERSAPAAIYRAAIAKTNGAGNHPPRNVALKKP
jgi:hypothetical protein